MHELKLARFYGRCREYHQLFILFTTALRQTKEAKHQRGKMKIVNWNYWLELGFKSGIWRQWFPGKKEEPTWAGHRVELNKLKWRMIVASSSSRSNRSRPTQCQVNETMRDVATLHSSTLIWRGFGHEWINWRHPIWCFYTAFPAVDLLNVLNILSSCT